MKLRHGDPPNFDIMPFMSIVNIAKEVNIYPNAVGRFLNKYYLDHNITPRHWTMAERRNNFRFSCF